MGNPTYRQLQTLKPLSTFEFCPSVTAHDESVTAHELLGPLTLQIIMAIMVPHGAVPSRVQVQSSHLRRQLSLPELHLN